MFADSEIAQYAKSVKAVVFDFDGVLTDNTELVGFASGDIVKRRSHYDGQGISLLRDIGLRICVATNERDTNADAAHFLVNKWNSLPSTTSVSAPWKPITLLTGVGGVGKMTAVNEWLTEIGISFSDCCVMGDDLVDYALLCKAMFRAAPITAEKVIRDISHWVSTRPAGAGAVRDLANFIFEKRGLDSRQQRFQ